MTIKIRWVVLLLVGITLLSLGLTAVTDTPSETEDDVSVVAVTYPLYTAALNVVGDTAGVAVTCLVAPTAGCVHEYQLSPSQMGVLAAADLVVRGAGDAFLDGALAALPHVSQVQTTEGLSLLSSCEGEHEGHHHEHNEHSWVSPALYAKQVEALRDGLCAVDPQNEVTYTANAAAYLEKIRAVEARLVAAPAWDGAVLFHDSVAYVAQAVGLPVLGTLPLGEEQGVSAGDLTAAAEAVRGKRVILLYDSQFAHQEFSLETYAAAAKTMVWETAVTPKAGVADKDTWLYAMEENLKRWEEIP